jgi:hypothetical protein
MPPHRGRGEERWAHLFTVEKSMPSFYSRVNATYRGDCRFFS